MKLRTELELQEYLDYELAWRIKEIDYTKGSRNNNMYESASETI